MDNTYNIPDELKKCLKTTIMCADQVEIILYHDEKMSDEEIQEISNLTAVQLKAIMTKGLGFVEEKI